MRIRCSFFALLVACALAGCVRPPVEFRSFSWPREVFDGHHERQLRATIARNWAAVLQDHVAAGRIRVESRDGTHDGNWLAAQPLAIVRFTDGAVRQLDGSYSPGCPGSLLLNRFSVFEAMRSLVRDVLILNIDLRKNPRWLALVSGVVPVFFVVRSGVVGEIVASTARTQLFEPSCSADRSAANGDPDPFYAYIAAYNRIRKPGRSMAQRRPLSAEEARAGGIIAAKILERLGFGGAGAAGE